MIRDVVPEDAVAIAKIYNHYIEQTVIRFELESTDLNEMFNRFQITV